MSRDFFDPMPDETDIVLVDHETLALAQGQILSCESCNPEKSEIPFDWVLNRITGRSGVTTDYILEWPASCPRCGADVREKTMVEWSPTGQGLTS